MDIQGGVAIVTGSSSGVGAACARQLAERGCHVVINYSRNEAGARDTEAACIAHGVETLVVRGDVAEDADCRRLAAAADTKWGRIDALVNNAGTTKFCAHNNLDGLDKQDFLDIYSVNTIGAFQILRPDITRQAKLRIIGESNRLCFVLKPHEGRHRAEDFFTAQTSSR